MKKWVAIVMLAFTFSSCDTLLQVLEETEGTGVNTGISSAEAVQGLKEALEKGVSNGTSLLGKTDGFFKSELYKILIPDEVLKAEEFLRGYGLGHIADNAIEAMNRGAEGAMNEAKDVFISAIKQMTIQDAVNIVTGGQGAATDYLIKTTSAQLREKFQPVIQNSLDQVGATKNWTQLVNTYNNLSLVHGKPKIDPDLNGYVTEKAMTAIFSRVRIEENKIRANPVERTTDILKKVFAYADSKR